MKTPESRRLRADALHPHPASCWPAGGCLGPRHRGDSTRTRDGGARGLPNSPGHLHPDGFSGETDRVSPRATVVTEGPLEGHRVQPTVCSRSSVWGSREQVYLALGGGRFRRGTRTFSKLRLLMAGGSAGTPDSTLSALRSDQRRAGKEPLSSLLPESLHVAFPGADR